MNGWIGIIDNEWFTFLSRQPGIDKVNFWQPGGRTVFKALGPGEPFLFKLHAADHFIAGGGFFAYSTIMPVSLAWEAFGEKNRAHSLHQVRRLVAKRREAEGAFKNYEIVCCGVFRARRRAEQGSPGICSLKTNKLGLETC